MSLRYVSGALFPDADTFTREVPMDDLEFSRQDIENLTQKLSTLELTEQERELLLAIFAAAADRARPSGPGEATLPPASSARAGEAEAATDEQETLADLQQQLLDAYTPTNSFDSVTEGTAPPGSIHPQGSIHPAAPYPVSVAVSVYHPGSIHPTPPHHHRLGSIHPAPPPPPPPPPPPYPVTVYVSFYDSPSAPASSPSPENGE
jgi:hypothetical protein